MFATSKSSTSELNQSTKAPSVYPDGSIIAALKQVLTRTDIGDAAKVTMFALMLDAGNKGCRRRSVAWISANAGHKRTKTFGALKELKKAELISSERTPGSRVNTYTIKAEELCSTLSESGRGRHLCAVRNPELSSPESRTVVFGIPDGTVRNPEHSSDYVKTSKNVNVTQPEPRPTDPTVENANATLNVPAASPEEPKAKKPKQKADASLGKALVKEIIEVTGDQHSRGGFKKIVNTYSEADIRAALDRTRETMARGGVQNPGAYFMKMVKEPGESRCECGSTFPASIDSLAGLPNFEREALEQLQADHPLIRVRKLFARYCELTRERGHHPSTEGFAAFLTRNHAEIMQTKPEYVHPQLGTDVAEPTEAQATEHPHGSTRTLENDVQAAGEVLSQEVTEAVHDAPVESENGRSETHENVDIAAEMRKLIRGQLDGTIDRDTARKRVEEIRWSTHMAEAA